MNVKFKKRLLTADVTAIRFVGKFVLAGIGGSLHIFDLQSSKLLLAENIFSGQKIHGIEIRDKYLISIFGGKKLAHCKINPSEDGSRDSPGVIVNNVVHWQHGDWILHLKWLAGDTVAVVTAHNNVSLHDSTGKIIAQASCQEKCIVYCALLVGSSWADLVVLAGTVFQEVVVWSTRDSADQETADETSISSDCPVKHRLKGHNGVIFSVSYDAASNTLATTSDDRSVRSWHVSSNWSQVTPRHVMFGHRARAWRCLAYAAGAILSVGEDSALCCWAENGRLERRWDAHAGARIWCIDFDERTGLVATGGGDGGVCIWPLLSSLATDLCPAPIPFPSSQIPRRARLVDAVLVVATEQGALLSRTIFDNATLNTATETAPSCPADEITPLIKNIDISTSNTRTTLNPKDIASGNNAVLQHSPVTPIPMTDRWSMAYSSPQLASYSLFESSLSGAFVAVAAINGWLAVFRRAGCGLELVAQENAVQGKVFSLRWLAEDALLVCADRGCLTVWVLVKETSGEERLALMRHLKLPPAKEAWPTAAVLFTGLLVCGDRAGSIHVFPLPEWRSEDKTNIAVAQTFPRLHGRLGVTCICVRGDRLWTGGRDGIIRQFTPDGAGLVPIAADKVPLPWVADLVESELGLLVLGFREVEFVVWSWKEQRTLFTVECGGGHRSWDFRLSTDSSTGDAFTFVYVKDKAVHALRCSLQDLVRPVLLMGFHLKEIGCTRLLRNPLGGLPLIVSASEDTTIRLSRLQIDLEPPQTQTSAKTHVFGSHSYGCQSDTCHMEGRRKDFYRTEAPGFKNYLADIGDQTRACTEMPAVLTTLATLRSHVSSVRALAFNSDQSLLFSGGGRAQLKVWLVRFDAKGDLAVTEQADHMLRGQAQRPWREALPAADPETRYMDLCCLPSFVPTSTVTTLAAGCSDGLLRFFNYDRATKSLSLLQETSFHDRCVLKVLCLVASNSRQVVVSMATDGRCAFWELSRSDVAIVGSSPFAVLQLHQSGINSVDWKFIPSDSPFGIFVFATGGDDNALVLTLIELAAKDVVVLARMCIESSHAAQITGVCFVDNCLVTACIDQCVRVWRWNKTLGEKPALECTLAGQYTSTVSDIQGLQVWSTNNGRASALVHGKGVEVIDIDIS